MVATYTYDSANRRIKKTAGATTTCYIWEGAQVVAEYNNAAAPSSPNTEYVFTGGRMLAEERSGSGTTRFFHQDRLSTRLTTNSTGAVLGTQSHLPFGEQLTESSEQQKWKFTTYERDGETSDPAGRDHQSTKQLADRPRLLAIVISGLGAKPALAITGEPQAQDWRWRREKNSLLVVFYSERSYNAYRQRLMFAMVWRRGATLPTGERLSITRTQSRQ